MTRVAVVHEWLHSRAGSEKTFESMAAAFPSADLYALTRAPDVDFELDDREVRTTWLDRAWLRERRSLTLPLMPIAWSTISTGPTPYDLVLTSSHAFANMNRMSRKADTVLSYCHAPARYLWTPELDSRSSSSSPWLAPARALLRRVDAVGARRVTEFAANSTEVAARIECFYGVQPLVIPPPVDVSFFSEKPESDSHDAMCESADDLPATFLLAMSRFIPYKRLDLAISVSAEIGVPIVVAGGGNEESALRRHAEAVGAEATFVIEPDQLQLRRLFRRAQVLIFPALEDFGIVPVEAQACGTPVVGLGRGGSLDTIIDGVTGVLAERQDVLSFRTATERALNDLVPRPGTSESCRRHAATFGADRFRRQMQDWVASHGF